MASLIKTKVNSRICSLKNFLQIKNKILVYRNAGGYGDILNMRMIFEGLKNQFPDFLIDWAVPYPFFPAASGHPFVNKLVSCGEYKEKDYLHIYNLTHACVRYEWAKGRLNDKNRADIWTNHIGCQLNSYNMHMPDMSRHFIKIVDTLKSLGWDGQKKIVVFTPRSSVSVKDLPYTHCEYIKKITKDFFLVILHNMPIIDLMGLNIPTISTFSLDESMAMIQFCDFVISTDTGHLHCAGGYKKPTLGLFCYTNGYEICKHYETVHVIQKHWKDDPDYCGPCNNYSRCHVAPHAKVKPCMLDITHNMIDKGWNFLVETYK